MTIIRMAVKLSKAIELDTSIEGIRLVDLEHIGYPIDYSEWCEGDDAEKHTIFPKSCCTGSREWHAKATLYNWAEVVHSRYETGEEDISLLLDGEDSQIEVEIIKAIDVEDEESEEEESEEEAGDLSHRASVNTDD